MIKQIRFWNKYSRAKRSNLCMDDQNFHTSEARQRMIEENKYRRQQSNCGNKSAAEQGLVTKRLRKSSNAATKLLREYVQR